MNERRAVNMICFALGRGRRAVLCAHPPGALVKTLTREIVITRLVVVPLIAGAMLSSVLALVGPAVGAEDIDPAKPEATSTTAPTETPSTAPTPTGDEEVSPTNPEALIYRAPQTTQSLAPDAANCPVGPDMEAFNTEPPLVDAWFNTEDIEERGIWDPKNHHPWKFSQRFARLLCGAADGATIKLGMYFIRATNGSNSTEIGRPESDPEVVYTALEWLAKNRNVKVKVILDNTNTCATAPAGQSCTHIMTPSARAAVEKRFSTIPNSEVVYCVNGCFNQMRYGVYPYAIEHEKFFTIDKTDFPGQSAGTHPLVISSSVNLARSQIRNYHQEASMMYDDQEAWKQFNDRFDGMYSCALSYCSLLDGRDGTPSDYVIGSPGYVSWGINNPNDLNLVQDAGRKIWADPFLYRPTDAGRGTRITFAPQRDIADSDVFVHQFDNVDCSVQGKIRLAMFKLTDAKAAEMVSALKDLKSRGCDIKMLMTSHSGQTVVSPSVARALANAKIDYACTEQPMHTKMINIGPMVGNLGSVLTGTANMSVAGQLYSEEHILTFDATRASGAAEQALKRVYGKYQDEWFALSEGSSPRHCS